MERDKGLLSGDISRPDSSEAKIEEGGLSRKAFLKLGVATGGSLLGAATVWWLRQQIGPVEAGAGDTLGSENDIVFPESDISTPIFKAINIEEYYQIVPWEPGGADYQIVPWKLGEAKRVTEQARTAWKFLVDLYGHSSKNLSPEKIILLKNNPYPDMSDGSFNLRPGQNIAVILLNAENVGRDLAGITHELTHEFGVFYPSYGRRDCFTEGLAVLGEMLITGEDAQNSGGWDYDTENTPEARFLDFQSKDAGERDKAYWLAGQAWRRWNQSFPGTIKEVNQWWQRQIQQGRQPTREEIINKFDDESNGEFSRFVERNYILNPDPLEKIEVGDYSVSWPFVKDYLRLGPDGLDLLGEPLTNEIPNFFSGGAGHDCVAQVFENGILIWGNDVVFHPLGVHGPPKGKKVVGLYLLGLYYGFSGREGPTPPNFPQPGDFQLDPAFTEFVNQHGGEEVLGYPVNNSKQSEDGVKRQYTTRLCLEELLDGTIRFADLGRRYAEEKGLLEGKN